MPRRRAAILAELEEELRFHLEHRAAELRGAGLSDDDAWRGAERRFGTLDDALHRLETTAQRREGRMRISSFAEALVQDTRFVARQLTRSPGFTIAVTLTLALGVGANATMFGVLDRLLLRPPAAVRAPDRLAHLSLEHREGDGGGPTWQQTGYAYADFRDVRDAGLGLSGVAAYWSTNVTLGRGVGAERVRVEMTTPTYFDVLGTTPSLGRTFSPEDGAEPSGQPVVVIGYGFWQRHFAGAANAIGQQLLIGPRNFTVIGVAPRYFSGLGLDAIDAWVPVTAADGIRFSTGSSNWIADRSSQWLSIVARLPDDTATVARAAAAAARMIAAKLQPGDRTSVLGGSFVPVLRKYEARDNPDVKVARLLLVVSIFVLIIACANVANLLLARAVKRRQEIAIRLALGIDAGRLTMMLLAESAILSVLGGVASLAVVHYGGAVVRARLLTSVTAGPTSLVDGRVLTFAALVTLGVMLVIGIAPLVQLLRTRITTTLGSGGRTTTGRGFAARSGLILAQVSLCTVLLVGTGLFVRSLVKLNDLRLGMDTNDVLVARLDLASVGRTPADIAQTYLALAERLRGMPGVQNVSVALSLPFWSSYSARVSIPGRASLPRVPDGGPYYNQIDEHYFATLGTRILRGRGVSASDRNAAAKIVVVNESMAELYWPGQDAVGKCIRIGADTMPCSTVVGVVENARRQSLVEGTSVQYFLPLEVSPGAWGSRVLFIRAPGKTEQLVEPIRKSLQSAAADFPYANVQPMRALLNRDFRPWTLGSSMFGAFGVVALLLAAVGLYGTLAYDVAQRSRELSVRIALGAQQRDIVRLVMRQGVVLAAFGVAFGIGAALVGGRWVRDLLYQVSSRDATVIATAAITLIVTAAVATALPAWRASRVDLRQAMSAE